MQTSRSYSTAPVFVHLELRDVVQTVFFVTRRDHYIFLEDVRTGDYYYAPTLSDDARLASVCLSDVCLSVENREA